MLTRFSVSGYKNFAEETTLDLSHPREYQFNESAIENNVVKCALIYGKNAVGKTNFGRALLDARFSRFVRYNAAGEESSVLNADAPSESARFSYEFRFRDTTVCLSYEKDDIGHFIMEKMLIDGKLLYEYDYTNGNWEVSDTAPLPFFTLNFDEVEGGLSILQYACNNSPAGSLGVISQTYDFIRRMGFVQGQSPSLTGYQNSARRAIHEQKLNELEAFLHRFGIEENLVAKPDPTGETVIYFDKKRLVPFYRNCSSGTKSLLSLFDALNRPRKPSLLFIDEFDACYHHELAEQLIEYFKDQQGTQVICTTHNTDLFSNAILRPDCLYILSPSGICTAADATDRELREGHNLEKLYKAGEFDA